jgi:predicted transcriptional regulator
VVSASRVVEILSSVGSEFTVMEVSSKLGVSQTTAKRYINDLVKAGFITPRNGKYVVTDKGLLLLELSRIKNVSTSSDQAYVFTNENGAPVVLRVDSVRKLYIIVKYGLIPESILRHHLEKGYIANWVRDVLGAKVLADKISSVKTGSELIVLLEQFLEA